jgi:transposase InsO family protein
MADLQIDRVQPDKPPFTYVGVDFFGPLFVKQGRSRVKRYGCLFTCLVIRAIHIEIAHSLDVSSFIDALRRFIARRGRPEEIRSDRGTNFIGAERELKESLEKWNHSKLNEFLCLKEIKWKFNPAAASHMGGAWERLIRSIKKILKALLDEQLVNDETLATAMAEVEAIVNSRPITPNPDSPFDTEALTPNHVLMLCSSSSSM